jgi:hypothetical protein
MTANQRPAVLYTLAQGPIATYSVDLKCEGVCYNPSKLSAFRSCKLTSLQY